jgi:hypothetical protein
VTSVRHVSSSKPLKGLRINQAFFLHRKLLDSILVLIGPVVSPVLGLVRSSNLTTLIFLKMVHLTKSDA